MTLKQTAQLLGAISRYYPNARKSEGAEIKAQIIKFNAVLMDYEFKQVCLALMEAITSFKYPPTAFELKELADQIEKSKRNPVWDLTHTINLRNSYTHPLVIKYVENMEVSDEEIFEVVNL